MPADGTEFVSLDQLKDYDTNRVATSLDLKLNSPASDGTNGQMLVYGSSGNQWADVPESTTYSADNETLQLSGTQFSVKDGGINAAKIAGGTITADKMASGVIPDVSEFITVADASEAYAAKSHTHANATASADGFMSSGDKTKLDGLQGQIDETKRLRPVNEISAGTDLDTLTEPGSWFCDDSTSVTNAPDGVAAEFLLYVYSGGGVVAHELRTPYGTWWRWKKDGTNPWDTWVRVLAPDGPLPIGDGGTGATTAADARTALGLGNLYSRAPYVRSKSATGALYAVTVVKTVANMYLEVMSASQVKGVIGREPEWGRDFAVVVNGDESASTNQVHTLLNTTTHDIDARIRSETGGDPKTGSMRLDVLIFAG